MKYSWVISFSSSCIASSSATVFSSNCGSVGSVGSVGAAGSVGAGVLGVVVGVLGASVGSEPLLTAGAQAAKLHSMAATSKSRVILLNMKITSFLYFAIFWRSNIHHSKFPLFLQ